MQVLAHKEQSTRDYTQARIEEILAGSPQLCRETLTYSLQTQGKAARAELIQALGEQLGIAQDRLNTYEVVVELLHLGTLVHDDVIDSAPTRRGQPALWRSQGVDAAVLAGDIYFMHAIGELARGGCSEHMASLAEALVRIGEGELMERQIRWNPQPIEEALQMITERKTGEIFAWLAGALARDAGADEQAARAWGLKFGFGFQLADDLLDFLEAENGKQAYIDLREGIVTLPVLWASQQDETLRTKLQEAFEHREYHNWAFGQVYRRLQDTGVVEQTRARLQAMVDELVADDRSWPPGAASLRSFVSAMLLRDA